MLRAYRLRTIAHHPTLEAPLSSRPPKTTWHESYIKYFWPELIPHFFIIQVAVSIAVGSSHADISRHLACCKKLMADVPLSLSIPLSLFLCSLSLSLSLSPPPVPPSSLFHCNSGALIGSRKAVILCREEAASFTCHRFLNATAPGPAHPPIAVLS